VGKTWAFYLQLLLVGVEAEEEVISVYLFLAILLHQASGFVAQQKILGGK
jgi:hypothetical protein